MATLNRAFAFTEMNKIAKSISKYLNLNVTRLLKQAFEKDGAISKGDEGFASCASQLYCKVIRAMYFAHALASPTCRGLNQQGKADTFSFLRKHSVLLAVTIISRDCGCIYRKRQAFGGYFRTHQAHSGASRPYKYHPCSGTCLDKGSVFGEATIT